jgi:uncharacterized membrane protein
MKDKIMAEFVKKRRWMQIVLGLSLAVNLAVIAAVLGAMLRHKDGDRGGPHARKGGAIYMQALPKKARHELRETLRATYRGAGTNPVEMLAVLREEPFDAAAAALVFQAQHDASLSRLQAASVAWLTEVTAMSAQERSVYADRLQELSEKHHVHRKDRRHSRD